MGAEIKEKLILIGGTHKEQRQSNESMLQRKNTLMSLKYKLYEEDLGKPEKKDLSTYRILKI